MPSTAAHGRTKKTPSGKAQPKAKAAASAKNLKKTKGAATPAPSVSKMKSDLRY